MSVLDVNPGSVKAAVRQGHNTRDWLAGHFKAMLGLAFPLTHVIDGLIAAEVLHEDDDGTLWIRREPDLFHQEEA